MQLEFETMCSLSTVMPTEDIDKIKELSVGKEEESMKEILSVRAHWAPTAGFASSNEANTVITAKS